jgi:hypothetical protein
LPGIKPGHPNGLKIAKWNELYVAPQIQHLALLTTKPYHSCLQYWHVRWLHPLSFSTSIWHLGHC